MVASIQMGNVILFVVTVAAAEDNITTTTTTELPCHNLWTNNKTFQHNPLFLEVENPYKSTNLTTELHLSYAFSVPLKATEFTSIINQNTMKLRISFTKVPEGYIFTVNGAENMGQKTGNFSQFSVTTEENGGLRWREACKDGNPHVGQDRSAKKTEVWPLILLAVECGVIGFVLGVMIVMWATRGCGRATER